MNCRGAAKFLPLCKKLVLKTDWPSAAMIKKSAREIDSFRRANAPRNAYRRLPPVIRVCSIASRTISYGNRSQYSKRNIAVAGSMPRMVDCRE
jgi:hypothetical protein